MQFNCRCKLSGELMTEEQIKQAVGFAEETVIKKLHLPSFVDKDLQIEKLCEVLIHLSEENEKLRAAIKRAQKYVVTWRDETHDTEANKWLNEYGETEK